MLSKNVNINITQNLKKATVYSPLNVSITICVREKQTYINAGGHRFSIMMYIYIFIGKKPEVAYFVVMYLNARYSF